MSDDDHIDSDCIGADTIGTIAGYVFFAVFFGMLMMLNAKNKETDAGKYVACLSAQEKVVIDLKCGGKK